VKVLPETLRRRPACLLLHASGDPQPAGALHQRVRHPGAAAVRGPSFCFSWPPRLHRLCCALFKLCLRGARALAAPPFGVGVVATLVQRPDRAFGAALGEGRLPRSACLVISAFALAGAARHPPGQRPSRWCSRREESGGKAPPGHPPPAAAWCSRRLDGSGRGCLGSPRSSSLGTSSAAAGRSGYELLGRKSPSAGTACGGRALRGPRQLLPSQAESDCYLACAMPKACSSPYDQVWPRSSHINRELSWSPSNSRWLPSADMNRHASEQAKFTCHLQHNLDEISWCGWPR